MFTLVSASRFIGYAGREHAAEQGSNDSFQKDVAFTGVRLTYGKRHFGTTEQQEIAGKTNKRRKSHRSEGFVRWAPILRAVAPLSP